MDETNPQSVNDDYVRTWTISSASGYSAKDQAPNRVQHVNITVKRKEGGAVSNFLHDLSLPAKGNAEPPLTVGFIGSGGGFSCFRQEVGQGLPTVPSRMLWIAGGVGITPFMAMWDGLLGLETALAQQGAQLSTDVVLVFAGRDDDLDLLRHFLDRTNAELSHVQLSILGFQSSTSSTERGHATKDALIERYPEATLSIAHHRMDRSSVASIPHLSDRETYLCGPEGFMSHTQALLESIPEAGGYIHTESYSF